MGSECKVISCKAAVAWEPGKPLTVEDVDVAPPKDHEVRVKISASGVCHTDWTYLYDCEKGVKTRPFPLVLGHEGAGVVEGVGPGVTSVQPGDKVIPLFLPQCAECEFCLNPKTNLCFKNWAKTQQGVLADGTSRITCRGQQVYQFLGVSSFCEYTVVPEHNVAKIDRDAPLDKVCLLGCGVATGYGAAVNIAKVERGSVCAVFGLGAVGLAVVMGCKAAGASRIIGVDINAEKGEIGKKFGVSEFVNPNDQNKPVQEVLVEMTGGGVDYSFECVGDVTLMRAVFESCRVGWGTCVIVGWNETDSLSLAPIDVLMGRTLKGTYFGGWKSVSDVPKLVDDYMSGRILLDDFVTHTLHLEEINHAFELMANGKSNQTFCLLLEVISCKAAVAWEPGKPLTVEDVDVAPPKDHEVRVKIAASSVCRTDWTYLCDCNKGLKSQVFPFVLGHEGAGVVESVGSGVTNVQPGDNVILLTLPQCSECDYCLNPKTNYCLKIRGKIRQQMLADGASRITCRGQQVNQFVGVSTFCEYTVVSKYNVAKIDRDAPLDKVCLLGCGVATGYGAAVNIAKVERGSVCAVFGLGAVGLAVVMGCKAAGASRIIGVDINAEKGEIGKKFGVSEFVNPNDQNKPVQEVLVEMTGGGVDYSFECVGNVTLMRAAFESCQAAWGTCVILGWTENTLLSFSPGDLVLGRTLKGSILGGCV
ncbi:alcohol dehydrogenase class-3-like [Clarias magur]|uniref:Alcohol dehydrogenase class-3-like n=1 Tax=Clarias magur TaxID=1594786 RepID=A0A8J4TW27_CLAMG|nr:alcohol dehydrogenase class-3-like [Clarias magur]